MPPGGIIFGMRSAFGTWGSLAAASGVAGMAVFASPPARAAEQPVEIASDPPGAEIYLEDASGEKVGETPFEGTLAEGVHTLILQLDGHETGVEVIDVRPSAGPQSVHIDLVELRHGYLRVVADDGAPPIEGAEVRLNGEPVGEAPEELEVPVGAHYVEVLKPGFELYEAWIEVGEGSQVEIAAALDPDLDHQPVEEADPETDAPIVTIGGGLEFGGRSFAYENPETENLRPYDAGGIPLLRAQLELFPLSRLGNPWLERIAVVGRAGWALPVDSSTEGGEVIGTSWIDYDIALRALFPVGDRARAGVAGGHGRTRFGFDDGSELADEVPDVDYRYARVGAIAGAAIDRYDLRGSASYVAPYERGATAARFRDADVWGLSLGASVGTEVAPGFDARVGLEYTRYAYALEADEADDHRADGGSDQFFGLSVAGVFSY